MNKMYSKTMTSSMISTKVPTVGVPHFKSVAKQTQAENNTFETAITDIVDNTIIKNDDGSINICNITCSYDQYDKPYKVSISDNIANGFENILKDGADNPLNMGHMRDGHQSDNETSEFGIGLKKAGICTANIFTIVTRTVIDGKEYFIKVTFEIPIMCGKENSEDSYQPTNFEHVTKEKYQSIHPYETGSTIILSELHTDKFIYNKETGKQMSSHDFNTYLYETLQYTYSELLSNNTIILILNGIQIEPKSDIISDIPLTNQIHHTIHMIDIHSPKIYSVKHNNNGRKTINIYCNEQNKFIKLGAADENIDITRLDTYSIIISMRTFTTKNTSHEETYQRCNKTDITRNGRCFGSITLGDFKRDGWSNHVANTITYSSKKINPLMGVGPNKKITKKDNILMSAICAIQKKNTSEFVTFNREQTAIKKQQQILKEQQAQQTLKELEEQAQQTLKEQELEEQQQKALKEQEQQTLKEHKEQHPVLLKETEELEEQQQKALKEQQDEQVLKEHEEQQQKALKEQQDEQVLKEHEEQQQTTKQHIQSQPFHTTHPLEIIEDTPLSQDKSIQLRLEVEVDNKKEIEESKNALSRSIQLLKDVLDDPNFDRTDGHKILDFVNKLLHPIIPHK